jgi:cell division protein FtsN
MTFYVNGNDIAQIVQVAATVGSIVAAIVVSFIVYLMVRPSRKDRERGRVREADPAEAEEMWRIVDLMERRLEVLERALAGQLERPRGRAEEEPRIFAPAGDGRESGRKE